MVYRSRLLNDQINLEKAQEDARVNRIYRWFLAGITVFCAYVLSKAIVGLIVS